MGKASKWFRSLLSSKKSSESSQAQARKSSKWNFSNSDGSSAKLAIRAEDSSASPYVEELDANKHAIAVAAATAAVAEAALAAAHAAAEVVRLTSGSGSGRTSADRRLVLAAVKIQSAFRAYLARRALRALKGLVKLQALVRGHIVRKQSADMLRRMKAMARIQARACAHRSYASEYSNARIKFSNSRHPGTTNIRKYEERSNGAKYGGSLPKNHMRSHVGNSVNKEKESARLTSRWLNHSMEHCTWNSLHETPLESGLGSDQKSDKILEIDTWKPQQDASRNNKAVPISQYFSAWNDRSQDHTSIGPLSRLSSKPNLSLSSEEVSSIISSKLPPEEDLVAVWTTENSPRLHSASSRPTGNLRGPFTPVRSECSRSLFGDYIGYPSYMSNTESSRAKVRSHSAPKQRVPFEELGWGAKFGPSLWESDAISEKGSALPANHRRNTYLYSDQVRRQRAPTRDAAAGYSSQYGHRH